MGNGVRVSVDGLFCLETLTPRELNSTEFDETSSGDGFKHLLSCPVGDRERILAATCTAKDFDASMDTARAGFVKTTHRCWQEDPSAADGIAIEGRPFGCTNFGKGERVGQGEGSSDCERTTAITLRGNSCVACGDCAGCKDNPGTDGV